MATVKYQGRVREGTTDGAMLSVTYFGTHEEMLELQNAHPVGEYTSDGRLKSSRVYQGNGPVWHCDFRYESDGLGDYSNAPDTAYGKKSAQLKGSMLSMPLETNKNYRANWNYYLAAAPGVSAVPPWWETATDCIVSDREKYIWIKTPGEVPADKKGRWGLLKEPTIPGVDNYDVAVYTVTESARFKSADAAGKMVANVLNKIGSPENDFGIKDGNWKCDDASVSWSGKYWLATLTWTKSGDDKGWNEKLYG